MCGIHVFSYSTIISASTVVCEPKDLNSTCIHLAGSVNIRNQAQEWFSLFLDRDKFGRALVRYFNI